MLPASLPTTRPAHKRVSSSSSETEGGQAKAADGSACAQHILNLNHIVRWASDGHQPIDTQLLKMAVAGLLLLSH